MTFARIAPAALILVAACSVLPIGGSLPVAGREFLSTSVMVRGVNRPLVGDTRIRIGFTDDGMISASAGCNLFGGAYRIDGGVLVVTGGATTEMGCQPALQAQDDWLFALLGAQPTLTLTGDELILEEGDTIITLLDREVADPDLSLVGPTWTVTSIIAGDAVSSVPEGVVATFIFTEGGLVVVNTGCNSGSGAVAVQSNTLRFGAIALTERACEGPAGDMERAVLMVLHSDVVRFQIEARSLELTIGDYGLQLAGS